MSHQEHSISYFAFGSNNFCCIFYLNIKCTGYFFDELMETELSGLAVGRQNCGAWGEWPWFLIDAVPIGGNGDAAGG